MGAPIFMKKIYKFNGKMYVATSKKELMLRLGAKRGKITELFTSAKGQK